MNLDKTKVLPLLRFHVPEGQRHDYINDADGSAGEDAEPGCWHGVEVAAEPSEGDKYVLVMPWADSTLSDEMRKKQIAGSDVRVVMHIVKCVAEALQHMHNNR